MVNFYFYFFKELNRCWRESYDGKEPVLLNWDGNYANEWDGIFLSFSDPPKFPLSLIFNANAFALYNAIFQVIFKLFRVEFALASLWKSKKVDVDFQKMLGIAKALRFHFMIEVIYRCHREFLQSFQEVKQFDYILVKHQFYLTQIQSGLLQLSNATKRCLDELMQNLLTYCYQWEIFDKSRFERNLSLLVDLLDASTEESNRLLFQKLKVLSVV